MMKNWMSWTGLVIALALLLLVNLLSNTLFKQHRVDLTDNQQYTLTEGTENIIAELEEPVTLRFYLSEKLATRLPAISPYANRVRELLQEYARKSDGQIRLLTIDPEPFSEAEDEAVAYGLQGVPVSADEVFYFGLVGTGATDEQQVIAFFSPERQEQIEYDLSKLVYQLTLNKKPTVGLLTSLPMNGAMPPSSPMTVPQPTAPWVVVDQLRQLFQVTTIEPAANEIPDEVDLLLIAMPGDLQAEMQYAVDQFILNGGRALIFTDSMAEVAASGPLAGMGAAGMGAQADTALTDLLSAWGIALTPGVVAADIQRGLRVQTNQRGRNQVLDYPVWMSLLPSEMAEGDIVTAEINKLTLMTPGVIEVDANEEVSVTPLLRTTAKGAEIDQTLLGFGQDPQQLLRDYQPADEPLVLAARISGKLNSAFADGPPEGLDNEAHLSIAKEQANVIVVADVDMLQDRAWVQVQNIFGSRIAIPNSGNGAFVVNAVENLLGNSDLISVRSRGSVERPFTLVQEITQQADQKFRQKEQSLLDQLAQTESKLNELRQQQNQSGQGGQQLILDQAQLDELAKFRQQKVAVRKDLRDVRHALRKDIEQVELMTKVINMGLVPLVVGLAGAVLIGVRVRRQRRAA